VASSLHDATAQMPKSRDRSRESDRTLFRHILVPTDLAARTAVALEVALTLAASTRSRVTLLHVIQTVPGLGFGDLRPFYEQLRTRVEKKLSALVRETVAASGVDIEIAYGPIAETILKVAAARRTDLIVLASHRVSATRVGRDWGTVSYKVGLLARCHVLLVK